MLQRQTMCPCLPIATGPEASRSGTGIAGSNREFRSAIEYNASDTIARTTAVGQSGVAQWTDHRDTLATIIGRAIQAVARERPSDPV